MNSNDVYVRAYAARRDQKKKPGESTNPFTEPKWPDHALIFDCESRTTADQTLTFGFWRFSELRNGSYVALEEGIFHADELGAKELGMLRTYARVAKPETSDDGSDRLCFYSRSEFVTEVLGIAIQGKALIVGFNLPFDLSRLAVDWENAEEGGWSLILSQWRNPKIGKLQTNKFFPRVVVRALNSKTAIIHSTRAPVHEPKKKGEPVKLWPAGRFLDLRTLLWALRNKPYSLKTASKEFGIPGKLNHKPSGRVDLEEIEYCRQDVRSTVGLLNVAKQEFDLHPIAPGPDRMFSPASVAKSYLEELHIAHPSEKVHDADAAYGVFMQSYFGGRAECRIRNWEVPVCPVDFMSQYPTVNELLGNWSVLTAKNVTFRDATKEVRQLLAQISLERCFDRDRWPQFKFFALVRPDNDILPVRTFYNGTTQNVGINYLTSNEPICFAGPDIIASILLTGKVPQIERAIRVVPHGKQVGFASTNLRGMVNVDAKRHSFFKHVIEQRAANESNPQLHYWLKILANSGSYGLFVELNPNEADDAEVKVYSGDESFETTSDVVEEPGKWFAPHIASLITSGVRLLLAMLERSITDAGGTYLFCDTDSAAIVSAKQRQRIKMPDGAQPITALSWAEVQRIVDRFQSLNPYDRKLVPGSILKVHKLNWDRNKQRRQLFGYSIAAKRYALYTKTRSDIEIVEPKAHGLGYFYPPKDSPEGWDHDVPLWIFEAWDWIMRGVLGLKRRKPAWFDLPVMMKLTLSTPHHALQYLAKGPLTRPKPVYHYTTQSGLLGIIKDCKIWATHTQYLNDRREFLHAVDLVREEIERLFKNTQTGQESDARMEALERMRDMLSRSPEGINVCVCSFSEANDSLSQWRAYGGSSGFAIGFSQNVLRVAVEKQKLFLAPCIYDPATQVDIVRALVEEVLDEYLSKDPGIEGWEPDKESAERFWETGGNLLNYLYRYAPMLKDRAFAEEREWRIVSNPVLAQHLDYREGRSLIIPYYPLPLWEDGQKTEIYEIIVGPTPDLEQSIKSLRKMIMGRDVIMGRDGIKERWGYTPIKASQVPYRDW